MSPSMLFLYSNVRDHILECYAHIRKKGEIVTIFVWKLLFLQNLCKNKIQIGIYPVRTKQEKQIMRCNLLSSTLFLIGKKYKVAESVSFDMMIRVRILERVFKKVYSLHKVWFNNNPIIPVNEMVFIKYCGIKTRSIRRKKDLAINICHFWTFMGCRDLRDFFF